MLENNNDDEEDQVRSSRLESCSTIEEEFVELDENDHKVLMDDDDAGRKERARVEELSPAKEGPVGVAKENEMKIGEEEDDEEVRLDMAGFEAPKSPMDRATSNMASTSLAHSAEDVALDPETARTLDLDDISLKLPGTSMPVSYSVKFHIGRWLEQFLLHMLYPLSLPFYIYVHGWVGARNQSLFTPKAPMRTIFAVIFQCFAWGPIILFLIYRDEMESQGLTFAECFVGLMLFTTHRMMIATKYAFLTSKEYEWYLTCDDPEVTYQFNRDTQLVSGWVRPKDRIIRLELAKAQARSGINLELGSDFVVRLGMSDEVCKMIKATNFEFNAGGKNLNKASLHSETNKWRNLLGEELWNKALERRQAECGHEWTTVSGVDLCFAMIKYCVDHGGVEGSSRYKVWYVVITILSAIHACLPGIVRVSCDNLYPGTPPPGECNYYFAGNSTVSRVIVISNLATYFVFYSLLLLFLLVIVVDFRR